MFPSNKMNDDIGQDYFSSPNLSISKTEMFDVNMAKYILAQPIDDEDKKKLRKMIKSKERGCYLTINYILGKKSKQNKYGKQYLGRVVPQGNFGLQTLSGDIRRALAKPFYWDLDIVNAQGEILNQIALKHNWVNTYLTELCSNRDSIFQNIMSSAGIDRSTVKVIFLSLFFGGKCKADYDDWIKSKFYPEIQAIMNNLCNLYPDLKKDCMKRKPENPVGSCCSIILQNEERKCLLTLDEFLTLNGRSMDTFIHDGGLVLKLKDETEFPPEIIIDAEQYVFEKTGYKLRLLTKSMETTFKMPNHIEEDQTYIGVKTAFEKIAFKSISESKFYVIQDRKIRTFSKTDLMTSYEHLKYNEIIEGLVVEKGFIKKWLGDSSIRTFNYVDTIIPPFDCPDDTFNLWDGLDVEHWSADVSVSVSEDIQFIKDHLKLLCGNDETLFEYIMKWIANIFQNPAKKNNIAVIFKSTEEGMGKNIFFELLQTMIGDFAQMIDKPERDAFGSFNGLMEDKILVLFDEFAGKLGFRYDNEIKSLITGTTIDITKKGCNSKKKNNYTKFIFNTNNDFPVKISADDRRFLICDSSNQAIPSKEYFEKFCKIKSDKAVLKAFYDELMDIDLTSIDWIRDRPFTESYNDIKMVSMDIELRFLLDYIENKIGIVDIPIKDFYDKFTDFTLREGVEFRTSNVKFGIKMKNYKICGVNDKRTNTSRLYSLNICEIKSWFIKKGYLKPEPERLLSP